MSTDQTIQTSGAVSSNPHPARRPQGTEYPGVCVVFFCHDGSGRFVMARRSDQARDEQGRWDIGGGGIDFGSTIDDTVRQEIREEFGAAVIATEFLGYRDVHRQPGGIQTHWIALDFKAQVDPAKVSIQEPHKLTDLQWFTLDRLPPAEELHSQLPLFLERYSGRLL